MEAQCSCESRLYIPFIVWGSACPTLYVPIHSFIYSYISTRSSQPSPIHTHHPTRSQNSQPNGHLDAVLNNIQLTTPHLMPLNWHFSNLDTRTSANNTAIATEDGRSGRRLRKHEHLNVEDPSFGVHVRHDMGKGLAREELEAALGVADT